MRIPVLVPALVVLAICWMVSPCTHAVEQAGDSTAHIQDATEVGPVHSQDVQPLFAGRNFDTWVHLLRVDLDESTRWEAVKAIGVLGAQGRQADALRILSPLLNSENRGIAGNSHQAIASVGDQGIALLVETLRDPAYPHRQSIVQALGKAGRSASAATETLVQIAKLSDIQLRRSAFESLVAIGAPPELVVDAIEKEILRSDDAQLSPAIVFALPQSPLDYEHKEDLLLRLIRSKDSSVRHAAASTLAQCGRPTDVVRGALRDALRAYAADPLKRGACPNVGAADTNVKLLLPLLIEVANEQDLSNPTARAGVFIGRFVSDVGELGESGRPAVHTLEVILQARKEPALTQIDSTSIQSLWKIGAGAQEALPTLRKLREEVGGSSHYRDRERTFHLKQIDRAIHRIQDSVSANVQ